MARYNTSQASKVITGTTTIVTPDSGSFVQLAGTTGYTVTLPTPAAFPGSNFTFYNATIGTVTLSTPNGAFNGTGGSGASTVSIFAGNVISLTSDGTNYIVISEDGSPLTATTGSFSSNVDINGTLTVNPSGGVSMSPSTVGSINNVTIGGTTRAAGSFTALAANSAVTFTANTPSTTTSSGTVVITGGLGVSGTINAASVSASLTGTIQTAAQPNITSVGTLTGLTVSGDVTMNATSAVKVPVGTTAQRPASPVNGMLRFNTTLNYMEEYRSNQWVAISNIFSATGGAVSTYSDGGITYRVHTFTSSENFVVQSGSASIDYLIVGGGAGGGGAGGANNGSAGTAGTNNTGGGGGGGGYYYPPNINGAGGTGGSGIIILRTADSVTTASSYTGTLYTSGGFKYYRFTSTGSITF
jgi:hypothetical protein